MLNLFSSVEINCLKIDRNFCFADEDIAGESIIRLIKKDDQDAIFSRLGLTTFGKVVQFKTLVETVLPAHLKRCVTPSSVHSAGSSKPSMSDLATYGKDMEMLYKAKYVTFIPGVTGKSWTCQDKD